jgi:hypothetical protein
MNDARRKEIPRALTLIGEAKGILELALSQEQDDLDNMPEDLQGDEEGQIAEDMVDALERAAIGLWRCDYRLQGGDAELAQASATKCAKIIGRYWASNPVLYRSDVFRLAPGFR